MDVTNTSYKLNYGLAETFHQKLVSKLKNVPFSLNLDEATSKSNKKVLTILVSLYDARAEKITIKHLTSVELVKTNAESIYSEICHVIEVNDIPWTNLISVLMDSCNVMCGHKSGVETRLRAHKAPYLLDIDGESCHYIHNAAKTLCGPFVKYLEDIFGDLHNNFKYSQDLVKYLKEMRDILDIRYITPERFVPDIWVSAYEITLNTVITFNAYVVLYYSFLGKDDKTIYKDSIDKIFVNVSSYGSKLKIPLY